MVAIALKVACAEVSANLKKSRKLRNYESFLCLDFFLFSNAIATRTRTTSATRIIIGENSGIGEDSDVIVASFAECL